MIDKSSLSTFIVAGATGLVGRYVLKQLTDMHSVSHIYALSRRENDINSPKLDWIIHPSLVISEWQVLNPYPKYGAICLGTTRHDAGSKEGLEAVDVNLVVSVAKEMRVQGVTHLAVISSYGANKRSLSHYLRCKGMMEKKLEDLGFESLIILRPGPLVGQRAKSRLSETVVQRIMRVGQIFMFGPLKNFIPVKAEDVAAKMIKELVTEDNAAIKIINSMDIWRNI
ncbi:NAD-dependent epimerase/dehydratase family protein [Vibrio viridaestus]|nr:NAD-dependent epimerase/dehydratase family protein [Vibrio viridaestus]